MSPQNYLKVISGHKLVVIISVALVGLFAFVFATLIPKNYLATFTLSVHRINREETKDFQYDNYYAIQAAEQVTNTIVNWLQTPDIALDIFNKAGIVADVEGLTRLSRKFKARQLSSHLARVEFRYKDQEGANRLSAALVDVIQEKVRNLETTSKNISSFEIQASSPLIVLHKINPLLAGGCGLVSGLFLGIALAFLFEYIKKEK